MVTPNEVAKTHSFAIGFNFVMTEYRWLEIDKALSFGLPVCDNMQHYSVLEVGAGEGTNIPYLKKRFNQVMALEPAMKYYEKLFNHEGIGSQNVSLEEYETDQEFDIIFFLGVLEHLDDPVDCLKKAVGLLSEFGRIVVTVPNADSLHRIHGVTSGVIEHTRHLSAKDYAVGHRRYYNEDLLYRHMTGAGLVIDGFGGIMAKPYPDAQMQRLPKDIIRTLGCMALDGGLPDGYCAELLMTGKKP